MMPIVDELEVEFGAQMTVLRLNAAEQASQTLMFDYGLNGHPSFAVLDSKGNVAQRFAGTQPKEALKEAMATVLEPGP
jgi:hypothetical protein